MAVVLGVDIGTSESKGMLVAADGTVLAQHRRPHRVRVPRPGHVEHDAESVWWDGFVEIVGALTESVSRAGEIGAVAVSGIGPCVLPIDTEGVPLRPAILYGVDTRAGEQIAELTAALGADEIAARCGTVLTSQSAGPKVEWIRRHEPEVFARTARIVSCQTFIAGRLTGRWVLDHATAAYYHPFYDQRTLDWNVDGAGGPELARRLPGLGWSDDVLGAVTEEAARLTGLTAGTPVLVGAPDAAAEAFSAGVHRPGEMMLMYGSSHFLIEVLDRPHHPTALWPAPYLFRDSHLLAAGTATAGSFTRWFADLLSATPGGGDALYTELAELAASSPPGARGLLALPYLSGERTPLYDGGARGVLLGMSLQHERADLARAVVESIAHSAAAALRAFDAEGLRPHTIRAVGGGTRNRAWVQAVADITGHPQEVVAGRGAAFGDAMLAAAALGAEVGAGWQPEVTRVAPRPELRELYDRQRELFDQLYRATRPLITALDDLVPQPTT